MYSMELQAVYLPLEVGAHINEQHPFMQYKFNKAFHIKMHSKRLIFSINEEEQKNKILQAFANGKYTEDKKHKGIEGPRYRVLTQLKGIKVIIVCEKHANSSN